MLEEDNILIPVQKTID